MRVKGVVFDKDGTLFDFSATWSPWAAAFLRRICKNDDAKAEQMGRIIGFDLATGRFDPASVVIAGTPEDILGVLAQAIPDLNHGELLEIINTEAEAAPMAEAVPLAPLLNRFRAMGLTLGVATNDAEMPAVAHLAAVGVQDRFDFIAGSDSGFGGKPAPGQLLAFCDQTGIAPENAVMVGDSLHDLRAGRAAGFACIGVLTGMATMQDLRDHADVVLPDIGHIPAWLEQLSG